MWFRFSISLHFLYAPTRKKNHHPQQYRYLFTRIFTFHFKLPLNRISRNGKIDENYFLIFFLSFTPSYFLLEKLENGALLFYFLLSEKKAIVEQ